jgi:hypothetical protein
MVSTTSEARLELQWNSHVDGRTRLNGLLHNADVGCLPEEERKRRGQEHIGTVPRVKFACRVALIHLLYICVAKQFLNCTTEDFDDFASEDWHVLKAGY